ncbi:uncharacterized protein LOC108032420 [Drosophila biarmipes]|uniref:uncharacterized protein LOC108032420 n=1 Tax=Drosophila biarmipes TaxID=125945 RepID=UPI0007E8A2B7|nr:uncharacterized protein LOC108032420 [Drosophila biarmipes]
MLQNVVNKERPIYKDIQCLTDTQLALMCQGHGIFPGPITFRNRRQLERELHIAIIEERAKYRAHQQFARECHSRMPRSNQQARPSQEHFGLLDALPQVTQQNLVPPTYWPAPSLFNLHGPVPSSSNFQNRGSRPDPVLEPRRYINWRQHNRWTDQFRTETRTNILGFNLPFSLEAALDFSSRISNTIKRFRGGGKEDTVQQETQIVERCQESQEKRFLDNYQDLYQEDYEEQSKEDYSEEELIASQEVLERDTLSESSEDKDQQPDSGKKNLRSQDPYVHPFPYDFRELQRQVDGADAESRSELCEYLSFISLSSVYHEFTKQVPMARTQPTIDAKPRFRWWWPRRATAGDERIPEAERTTEQDLQQERELKTINYLSDASARLDDGMLELMGRVELRDDSEEEGVAEEQQGSRSHRSSAGFLRHIFRLLCCDRQGKLDAEKLRCTFLCCCMAFGVYVTFKMLR